MTELPRLQISATDVDHEIPVHRIAKFPDYCLAIVSAAGPQGQMRSFAACLHGNGKLSMTLSTGHPFRRLSRDSCGYQCYWHRLPYGCLHLVALAKREGLLPEISQRGLWREFMSYRYETPMLFGWVPKVGEVLIRNGELEKLDGYNLEAGYLTVTRGGLDSVVSEGVKNGELEIPEVTE